MYENFNIIIIFQYVPNTFFSGVFLPFYPGRGSLYIPLSAAGHAGGLRVHRGANCGSRPGSVARALGIQSSEFWQITPGSHSDLLEPSRSMESPQFQKEASLLLAAAAAAAAAVTCVITPFLELSATRSHERAAVAHQALPLVTATDGALVCAFM